MRWERPKSARATASIAASSVAALLLAGCGQATTSSQTSSDGGITTLPAATSSGSPGTSNTPAGLAVTTYFTDLGKNDCVDAYALLTDPLSTSVGSATQLCANGATGNISFTVGTETDSGTNAATIAVSVTKSDGSVHNDTVDVVQVGGVWKLSAINVSTATASPGSAPPGQINADAVTSTIEQQYPGQSGGATATLTCPRTGNFASTPGDSYQCTFSDSNGKHGSITVSVTSTKGDYTWAIG